MEYNLIKSQKEAAKHLVMVYRENNLSDEVRLYRFSGREGFSIGSPKLTLPPQITMGTLHALADEKMIDLRFSSSEKTWPYWLTFRERLFAAVETNFGEIKEASPIPSEGTVLGVDIKVFREILERDFKLEDIKTLCHDMRIEFENLGDSNTLAGRIRELIQHCQRHGRLLELLITTAKARPRNRWHELWR